MLLTCSLSTKSFFAAWVRGSLHLSPILLHADLGWVPQAIKSSSSTCTCPHPDLAARATTSEARQDEGRIQPSTITTFNFCQAQVQVQVGWRSEEGHGRARKVSQSSLNFSWNLWLICYSESIWKKIETKYESSMGISDALNPFLMNDFTPRVWANLGLKISPLQFKEMSKRCPKSDTGRHPLRYWRGKRIQQYGIKVD